MTSEATEPRQRKGNFFDSVSDPEALAEAALVEGVDDELAELRVRLRELIGRQKPENFELILRGMTLIVRAAGVRYRMSPKSKDELGSAVAAVVEGVGVQLFPEEEGDV
ncbi:MAG: hypothetical protein EPO22_05675 [Dehalococcoidia bacterium]|nr:MAG: hypothetical protein EPO22_05675 [Dehalococcoidia bacterium]